VGVAVFEKGRYLGHGVSAFLPSRSGL
jgi:hypothetical protein